MIVDIQNLSKSFKEHHIFEDFSLQVESGAITVITGPSGSGKSTLLNMIGLLDQPDKGTITLFKESNIKPFSRKAEVLLREKIGYLFQNFALVDDETVEYNLAIGMHEKNKKKQNK